MGCLSLIFAVTSSFAVIEKTTMCESAVFLSFKVNASAMADPHLMAAVKAFRNCSPGGPESQKFLVADPDVLVENHEEVCLELLQLHRRMTVNFLQTAIGKAFRRLTPGECTAWAQRLDAGLKHIVLKKIEYNWKEVECCCLGSHSAARTRISSSRRFLELFFQQTFPRFYFQESFPFRH